MVRINVRSQHATVIFAAEELKKYLRMMMPEGGEIDICFGGDPSCGLSVGLMEAFGLDASDVSDPVLDEILYADTRGECGIIAGNNPRATLLSVYEYLRRNGCRWLMPGKDGEFIPLKSLDDVSFRHKPSRRYRGWCNEGATSQEALLNMIDFTPKVGMNVCMLQFRVPAVFYERYYGHTHNEENRVPEGVTREQVIQWTRECEAEISRRSLQLHSVGHGFTIDPFGIDSANTWSKMADSEIPEETRRMHLGRSLTKTITDFEAHRFLSEALQNEKFWFTIDDNTDNFRAAANLHLQQPLSSFFYILYRKIFRRH